MFVDLWQMLTNIGHLLFKWDDTRLHFIKRKMWNGLWHMIGQWNQMITDIGEQLTWNHQTNMFIDNCAKWNNSKWIRIQVNLKQFDGYEYGNLLASINNLSVSINSASLFDKMLSKRTRYLKCNKQILSQTAKKSQFHNNDKSKASLVYELLTYQHALGECHWNLSAKPIVCVMC